MEQNKVKPDAFMADPAQAENLKNQGNEAFKVGNYQQAILYYSEALGNPLTLMLIDTRAQKERSYSH